MNDQETLSGERGADSVQRPCSARVEKFLSDYDERFPVTESTQRQLRDLAEENDRMADALRVAATRFRSPRFGCEWDDAAEDCERALPNYQAHPRCGRKNAMNTPETQPPASLGAAPCSEIWTCLVCNGHGGHNEGCPGESPYVQLRASAQALREYLQSAACLVAGFDVPDAIWRPFTDALDSPNEKGQR